jgi:hypothetical protein
MSDKNKFRGLSMVSHEWLYGDCLHISPEAICIVYDEYGNRNPIFTESLGQSTGSVDSNNVEIYEGDIMLLPKDLTATEYALKAIVTYKYGSFYLTHIDIDRDVPLMLYFVNKDSYVKGIVVSNSFEKQVYGE